MNNFSSIPHPPVWRGVMLAAALSIAAGGSGGCAFLGSGAETETGEEIQVPDDDGIYADQGEDLMRLDGDLEWENETWDRRSNLDPDTVFVIKDPTIEDATRPLEQMVGVRKVAWVRSEISDKGEITPVTGSNWQAVAVSALEVDLDHARAEDSHEDLIQLRPQQPLEPGL